MNLSKSVRSSLFAVIASLAMFLTVVQGQSPTTQDNRGFRFKAGVDVVNVTATVFDGNGHFVPGLGREDFRVYEDDQLQVVTDFSAERVPVSLGILLDTSGSMAGPKIDAARAALDRFLNDLLDEQDEVFLQRFNDSPQLMQGWTNERGLLSRALARLATPMGGTAIYDAIAEALPLAEKGRHAKKALLISDGNDTSSLIGARAVREQLQQTDVLLYAVGVDGPVLEPPKQEGSAGEIQTTRWHADAITVSSPAVEAAVVFPGAPGLQIVNPGNGRLTAAHTSDHVNVDALRLLTDDSGGRTEVVRSARDLEPATTSIANELSRQYQLAYASPVTADGRWHTIRLEIPSGSYKVRARTGYIAN